MGDEFLSPKRLREDFSHSLTNYTSKNVLPDSLRAQWTAGHLGEALESIGLAVKGRIVGDDADFELTVNQSILRFQHTEATHPEIKPGKEFTARRKNPLHGTPYEPQRGMQEGPHWIADSIRRKVDQHYSVRMNLIVYASFDAEDLDVEALRAVCARHRQEFLSIWIIQDHRVVQLFASNQTSGWALSWIYFPEFQK